MGAAASHVVLRGGARIMMRRLIAALILAALIIVCVSGCHLQVTAQGGPERLDDGLSTGEWF
jgi:hypothetical protein